MIFWIFASAFLLQAAYWLLLHRGFGRGITEVRIAADVPPVTVVVAAHNEEHNLPRLLSALEKQSHPRFEVVVVDDGSTDDTVSVARAWRDRLPGFRLIVKEHAGKKRALTAGVEAASFDLLAFTDADCSPPATWLSTLASAQMRYGPCLLIGFGPLESEGVRLVERFAQYETFVTAFLTASAAGLGFPYMAVGRNLSYPKEVYSAVGGFEHSMESLSGDDDLLVQEVSRLDAAEIHAVLDSATFVPSSPPSSWRAWFRTKRRHASAGRFYRPAVQAHLLGFHLSNALVWLAPFFAGWAGAAFLLARLTVQGIVLHRAAVVLHQRDAARRFPVMEILYLFYNAIVAPLGVLMKPRGW